jgi:5'-phosphate synthase pdxT subunit
VITRVGVLALQGDFQKHIDALSALGADAREVRSPGDLADCERLIIPGGESTTLEILLGSSGLGSAIVSRAQEGMPVWGTCMGMILLAKEIEGREQTSFGLLDVVVRRNAFGRQVFSFEADLEFRGLDAPLRAVFIRAPIVVSYGPDVEELAVFDGKTVAVRQGRIL